MDKDIFSFDDFIKESSHEAIQLNQLEMFDEIDELKLTKERLDYLKNDFGLSEDDLNKINISEENKSYYNLYRDVNESFSCDIFIEGTNPSKAEARLVIESEDWNLIFNGQIENGKCNIPIRRLDLLRENLVGNIKLEIIAEGNIFIPWQDKFLVKSSKKISTFNGNLSKEIDVKVDSIK